MNYEQSIDYIHSIPKFCRPLGNANLEKLLTHLDNPQKKLKFIHIAGTNGKGSTAAMTAEILKKSGFKTGLFTSPYLEVFNERIRINGENITDNDLAEYVTRVKAIMEENNALVSEFAFITAVSFLYFYEKQCDIVVLEEYSTENGYDENFDVTDIHITGSRKHYFTHELKYDNGVEKTLTLPAMKFLSVRTWDKVRDYIRFHDDMGHLWDERMRRCDTERVGRVVNHFQNDDNAYFMVINAPNTEVHLITGEIGICSLLTGQRGHFELPRVSYQTSKGNVVLFPDEIMPVDINLLQQEINEGYIMLSDGRYLPPKEAVQQCYNAFGIRVGLGDNWEDIYDGWNKEMK